MSDFWSGWIMGLVVLNMGITLFLFIWAQRVQIPTQPDGTSGHIWASGLREGVRPLPTWWALFSAACFVWAIAYLVLYPGFGAYKGLIGWSAHAELASDTAANDAKLDPVLKGFDGRSIEELAKTPEATRIGHRLFVDNCAACHGLDARGVRAVGGADLTDAHWLWGGTPQAIVTTILDGRTGVMPPFGAMLDAKAVENLANYVLSLSDSPHSSEKAAAGKAHFTVCAACHGPDGKGNPALGAPDLTNKRRLYGERIADIEFTIQHGRTGTMPAWRQRLGEADVRLVAAWVYAQSPHDSPPASASVAASAAAPASAPASAPAR